ncbi:hypothetical protein [Pseudonocardia alni]|uniref:hypothetical protein n=1 Tax=Pseudonocardia alni TaxID=33907 RepID=UPI001ABFF009|nr:hypothetical protein [Pseudonocardia alni]
MQAFVADPAQIGQPFLAIPPGYRGGSRAGYTVATTSGTTGTRGMFLLDERALAVTTALSSRMLSTWLNASALPRLIAGRGRLAMVTATAGTSPPPPRPPACAAPDAAAAGSRRCRYTPRCRNW